MNFTHELVYELKEDILPAFWGKRLLCVCCARVCPHHCACVYALWREGCWKSPRHNRKVLKNLKFDKSRRFDEMGPAENFISTTGQYYSWKWKPLFMRITLGIKYFEEVIVFSLKFSLKLETFSVYRIKKSKFLFFTSSGSQKIYYYFSKNYFDCFVITGKHKKWEMAFLTFSNGLWKWIIENCIHFEKLQRPIT